MIDDLDLPGSGAQARDRIHGLLGQIFGGDDLCRVAAEQRIRLVVEHERAVAVEPQDVEATVHEHSVQLEGERPLGPSAAKPGNPHRKRRAGVRAHELADPCQLVAGDGRIPGANLRLEVGSVRWRGCCEVDELE